MYIPPRGIFSRLVESAFLFALAAWLVRTGICLLRDVWVWIVILAALAILVSAGIRVYKHYKDTHF